MESVELVECMDCVIVVRGYGQRVHVLFDFADDLWVVLKEELDLLI